MISKFEFYIEKYCRNLKMKEIYWYGLYWNEMTFMKFIEMKI